MNYSLRPNAERTEPDADLDAIAAAAGVAPAAPGDEMEIEELEDGSAIIRQAAAPAFDEEFGDNLVKQMDQSSRKSLGAELLDLVERDIEARKARDELYAEALKRTGLAGEEESPGGASFPGAHKVVHPILAEACVDYESAVIKELLPPDGPVKTKIVGHTDKAKLAKADRKSRFLNWLLTTRCTEYSGEMEQLHTQLPLGGSQYLKVWWDVGKQRPRFEFLPIDDVFLPSSASQWKTATRRTVRMRLDDAEWRRRIDGGLYLDLSDGLPTLPEPSEAGAVSAKVEGVVADSYNENGVRLVYEVYAEMEIDGIDEGVAPYIITIDDETRDVVGIYRNWEQEDDSREELPWIVEWQFVPWRGALGIGLWHLIGGLARSMTGSLRALLDSAHLNNTPTLLKLKGARVSGQSTTPKPGETAEVEGPVGATDPDVRKLFMPMPFNPPSPVLLQLLGTLTDAAKGVVSTAEEKIADASATMPVGTVQALIEQGSKVFSAIHARQHRSQAEVLQIVHRLCAKYLDDEITVEELGELVVSRVDFEGPMDVIPVSDPAIFSEVQRYSQAQAVLSLSQQAPQLFDLRAVYRRVLGTLKVPNIDELLPGPPEPKPTDPVTENMMMLTGAPVRAFAEQDHLAHIKVLACAIQDPLLGGNPLLATKFLPSAAQHIAEHVALFYYQSMMVGLQGDSADGGDPQRAAHIAHILAEIAPMASGWMQQNLAGVPDLIKQGMQQFQQTQQMLSSLQPPAPQDPSAAAAMAEVQRRTQRDQQDGQIAQAKLQQEGQQQAAEIAEKARESAVQTEIKQAELRQHAVEAAADDRTALAIEALRQRQPMGM